MALKNKILLAVMMSAASITWAQSPFDAYSLTQQNLRGTARYMSMSGAYGALGGDISALNQNPGGIGVYRSSDINITLDGAFRKTETSSSTYSEENKVNSFNFNNVGYVGAYRFNSGAVKNINWGFSYNKKADFRRTYSGGVDDISNSLSNYVAGQTNNTGYTGDDLGAVEGGYNPYLDSNAPWMSILAYNSYLINPVNGDKDFVGLMNDQSVGNNSFFVDESGQVDEYTISFGGNALNKIYWGVSLALEDIDFSQYTYYEESINNATVPHWANNDMVLDNGGTANWSLENTLRYYGVGVNLKAGVIFKPINQLRIGVAFHTPTRYSITSEYLAGTTYDLQSADGRDRISGAAYTDEGYVNTGDFSVRTPWKFIGSLAGVIGTKGLVSVDFEHTPYQTMRVMFNGREDRQTTQAIKDYYKAMETIRIGGEYRVTPSFSLRAGYAYQTSPFTDKIKNSELNVITAGTTPAYTVDKSNQYVTAGMGFKVKSFYADLAYVYNKRKGEYFAFSPDVPDETSIINITLSPSADVTDTNHEIVVTMGFRF